MEVIVLVTNEQTTIIILVVTQVVDKLTKYLLRERYYKVFDLVICKFYDNFFRIKHIVLQNSILLFPNARLCWQCLLVQLLV